MFGRKILLKDNEEEMLEMRAFRSQSGWVCEHPYRSSRRLLLLPGGFVDGDARLKFVWFPAKGWPVEELKVEKVAERLKGTDSPWQPLIFSA